MKLKGPRAPRAGQPVAVGLPPLPPIIVFTRNGAVIGTAIAPPGANDVRMFFGVLGGFGWWTKNRVFMPNGGFLFPLGTNDIHFSTGGQIVPRQGLTPPPGANDIDLFWDENGDLEGWWTRDGIYLEPIRFDKSNRREFHCSFAEPLSKRATAG